MKKISKKAVKSGVVVSLAGCLAIGGVMGASAFFTDKASTSSTANAGTMNMVFSDYSDLDGNYRNWTSANASDTVLVTNGFQAAKIEKTAAYDATAPSLKIINPGDTGLLQFSLISDKEKSFNVGVEVVVQSSVELTDGADEYTVDGLGTPVKSDDKKTLTYRVDLGTFNGTAENDGGYEAGKEHVFAYNVNFSRLAGSKFSGANFTINVNAYAKQARNSIGGEFKTDVADATGNYNTKLVASGDWASIGGYEITLAGSDKTNGGTIDTDDEAKTTATLLSGQEIHNKLKSLEGEYTLGYALMGNVTAIKNTTKTPEAAGAQQSVELQSEGAKVVAYIDPTAIDTILVYTDANKVYLNSDASNIFHDGFFALTDISALANWDTSKVTDMSYLLAGTKITNTDALSGWDTSKVTNMTSLFAGDEKLSDITGLKEWDTSNVTNMQDTFYRCGFEDISVLSNWSVDNVTNMCATFRACSNITNVKALAGWHTDNVTTMVQLFCECSKLSDISGLREWETGAVTDMSSLFDNCGSLTSATGLEKWDTSNVTRLYALFNECYKLKDISALASWKTGAVTDMQQMLAYCEKLTDVTSLAKWDTSNVQNIASIFKDCSGLTTLDLSNWDLSGVTSTSNKSGAFSSAASTSKACALTCTAKVEEIIKEVNASNSRTYTGINTNYFTFTRPTT